SDWHKEVIVRADKRDEVQGENITGWKIAVTEGAKEPKLLDGDNINATLRQRSKWFVEEFGKKGISGVDLKRMLLTMMESLEEGVPVNDIMKQDGTWTFVNMEPEKDCYVSGVRWLDNNRQVLLYEYYADVQADNARLRASVMVDVPRA
ncbi:hypothetical protein HYW82_01025, partial [Candidatus Peregrinibacteria bacterium]|nr:hypothetical protein [Candidatus Peregrinibacteria bacterium]